MKPKEIVTGANKDKNDIKVDLITVSVRDYFLILEKNKEITNHKEKHQKSLRVNTEFYGKGKCLRLAHL